MPIGFKPKTPLHVLSETQTQKIFHQIGEIVPDVVIIDSIQTLQTNYIESSPGSVSQIKECTAELIQFAKRTHTPVILVGHITKEGNIAGPKVMEHMVDTVLHFRRRNHIYRILRHRKTAWFNCRLTMKCNHWFAGVNNPSFVLLTQSDAQMSGHAIASTMEGAHCYCWKCKHL